MHAHSAAILLKQPWKLINEVKLYGVIVGCDSLIEDSNLLINP